MITVNGLGRMIVHILEIEAPNGRGYKTHAVFHSLRDAEEYMNTMLLNYNGKPTDMKRSNIIIYEMEVR